MDTPKLLRQHVLWNNLQLQWYKQVLQWNLYMWALSGPNTIYIEGKF